MAIVAVTPSVVQDIVDSADERELWIVGREFERPPYFFPDEGIGNRLGRALRVVSEDRITPNSDGSYTVEGSGGRTYRCAESCSCPNSQKSKSKWCYHLVATALYAEWHRRLRPMAPVALGTLRAGTAPLPRDPAPDDADDLLGNGSPVDDETLPLALGPVSVEARLAQSPTLADRMANYTQASLPPTPDDEDPQYLTPPTPQEAPMPADAYIPEPETAHGTTAVLAPPVPTHAVTTPSTSSLDARALVDSMAAWKEQRQILARYIKEQLTDGVDYYTLRIKGRDTKPTLSKAGSEKFLAIFKMTATFQQDQATWTMLGAKEGLLCYTCTLMTRSGEVIGEGRGARSVTQDGGDINKAIKMATKSAQIDAILRTGCLSDVFTQDINEPDEAAPATPTTPTTPTSQALRARIWAIVQQRAVDVRTRDAVSAWVEVQTGLALHPDNYQTILTKLEVTA